MKKSNYVFQISLLALSSPLFFSACSNYSKQPVSNAQELRQKAATQDPNGAKPAPVPAAPAPADTIEKDITTIIPQAVVDDRSLIIIPDSPMSFTEGIGQSYSIKVRSAVPGTEVRLTSANLPTGAVLKDISTPTTPGVYSLSWTPDYSTISGRNSLKNIPVKLTAQMILGDGSVKAGLSKEVDINLSVFHDQAVPGQVTIENLPAIIDEGTTTSFDVVASIADVNQNSSTKPNIQVSYDQVSFTDGNQFLEMDGSRYIIPDVKNKLPEYVGDNKWRFHLIFDTKNISVQPQLSASGTPIASADGVRVRASFKVFSPYGPASPETVKQIKITFAHPTVTAAPAPSPAPVVAPTTPSKEKK
jgi:hypothetical protein